MSYNHKMDEDRVQTALCHSPTERPSPLLQIDLPWTSSISIKR